MKPSNVQVIDGKPSILTQLISAHFEAVEKKNAERRTNAIIKVMRCIQEQTALLVALQTQDEQIERAKMTGEYFE